MNLRNKHILIVEDESILFLELKDLLLGQKFSIDDYTPSFKTAIERIENKKPDLVIIDIQLQGDLDGFDLGVLLSRQYGIPFLYLTDYDSDANYERGLQTGQEFFFSKKKLGDEKLFFQTIKSILNRFENFNGVLGLVEYREKIREMGVGMVGYIPVNFEEIAFLSKDRFINKEGELEELSENYIWFQTYNGEHYFLYKSLRGVLRELPDYFIRVNGKYIVNVLNKKSKIVFGESHLITLKRELEVTETYRKNFKALIGKLYGGNKSH